MDLLDVLYCYEKRRAACGRALRGMSDYWRVYIIRSLTWWWW